MSLEQTSHLMSRFWQHLFFRLFVVVVYNLIIKSFDRSFEHAFEFSQRNLFSSSYFIAFWLGAWYLGESALFSIRKRQTSDQPYRLAPNLLSLIAMTLYGIAACYTYTYSYKSLDLYLFRTEQHWPNEAIIESALFLGNVIAFFIGLGFHEFFYSMAQSRELQLRNMRLKEEQTQAKLHALVNQLDPHFLFNSLSAIESLAYRDPEETSRYISRLSQLYRYILDVKERALVPLHEELTFFDNYCYLMKTRHGDGIHFERFESASPNKNWQIPPLTLQLLAENAVKHNRFSAESPLVITLTINNDSIEVYNNIHRRQQLENTPKSGLQNIKDRYQLLTNKSITVTDDDSTFQVKLPQIVQV